MTRYLTGQEVLVIHHQVIEQTGGSHGVRYMNLFLSTIERPQSAVFGEEQFSTVFEKAATYLESFAQYQLFVDGNKRTGLASAARFLFVNGLLLAASNKNAEAFVMQVATKKIGLSDMARWLEQNSQPK